MRILEPERRVFLQVRCEGEQLIFQAEIADPSTELDIEIAVARRLNGASLESIPNSVYGYIVATCTLNYVIQKFPENFPFRFNSFEEILDKEFVVKLFNEYKKKENWFQTELKKNRDTRGGNFRREKPNRFHSDKRVSDSTSRSNEPRQPISRAEKIPDRSVEPNRHRNISETNAPSFGETSGRKDESKRISRINQSADDKYPKGRGRVLERTDSGSGRT